LSKKEWRAVSDLFDDDIVSHVTSRASVAAKRTPQSTSPEAVGRALASVQGWLTDQRQGS
jgi:argininosuccinate lyase